MGTKKKSTTTKKVAVTTTKKPSENINPLVDKPIESSTKTTHSKVEDKEETAKTTPKKAPTTLPKVDIKRIHTIISGKCYTWNAFQNYIISEFGDDVKFEHFHNSNKQVAVKTPHGRLPEEGYYRLT